MNPIQMHSTMPRFGNITVEEGVEKAFGERNAGYLRNALKPLERTFSGDRHSPFSPYANLVVDYSQKRERLELRTEENEEHSPQNDDKQFFLDFPNLSIRSKADAEALAQKIIQGLFQALANQADSTKKSLGNTIDDLKSLVRLKDREAELRAKHDIDAC